MYQDVVEAQSIHILEHEDGKKEVFYWNKELKERKRIGRVITVVLDAIHKFSVVVAGSWIDFEFRRKYKFFVEVKREYMRIREIKER